MFKKKQLQAYLKLQILHQNLTGTMPIIIIAILSSEPSREFTQA